MFVKTLMSAVITRAPISKPQVPLLSPRNPPRAQPRIWGRRLALLCGAGCLFSLYPEESQTEESLQYRGRLQATQQLYSEATNTASINALSAALPWSFALSQVNKEDFVTSLQTTDPNKMIVLNGQTNNDQINVALSLCSQAIEAGNAALYLHFRGEGQRGDMTTTDFICYDPSLISNLGDKCRALGKSLVMVIDNFQEYLERREANSKAVDIVKQLNAASESGVRVIFTATDDRLKQSLSKSLLPLINRVATFYLYAAPQLLSVISQALGTKAAHSKGEVPAGEPTTQRKSKYIPRTRPFHTLPEEDIQECFDVAVSRVEMHMFMIHEIIKPIPYIRRLYQPAQLRDMLERLCEQRVVEALRESERPLLRDLENTDIVTRLGDGKFEFSQTPIELAVRALLSKPKVGEFGTEEDLSRLIRKNQYFRNLQNSVLSYFTP